jgi:ribonuclease HI
MSQPILIYCDGACTGNPGPGGWGAIVATPDGRVRELGGGERLTTNNRMEMEAAMAGLAAVSALDGPVELHTDSTYLIKGITEWIHGWRRRDWKAMNGADVANRELWERLDKVVKARQGKIDWRYVKGHSGVPGNERCDAIAVSFAQGKPVALFDGPVSTYTVGLEAIADPSLVRAASRKSSSAKAHSYVSLLGGVPMRHSTWAECERRVKGKANAKYRKATSAQEESEILRSWGVDPARLG